MAERLTWISMPAAALLLIGAVWLPIRSTAAADLPPGTPAIVDYMVMQVCVDAQDKVLMGLTPLSPGCTRHRPIREGENLPYHLAGWAPPPQPCSQRVKIHDNVAVMRNGLTRTVTVVRDGYDTCADATVATTSEFYEVHWFDQEFGFILGAWAKGHGHPEGVVGGGISPSCMADPQTSLRFYRFWVLSSRIIPPVGQVGYGVFAHESHNAGLPPLDSPCPVVFRARYLAMWSHGPFTYHSGATLDSVISDHYDQADLPGIGPGKARQIERIYWTRELGQTRWEAWKREEFVYKNGITAAEAAQKTFQKDTCSKPYQMPARPTPGLVLGPITADGAYAQLATDPQTGERHLWYLVACLDMSNLVIAKAPGGDPFPTAAELPAQYWDYWAPSARESHDMR